MRCNYFGCFPRHQLQRKPLVSDPGMHHGTCVTHVSWSMSGSLTRGGGENVPGTPGACATRNFTYRARGPLLTYCQRIPGGKPRWILRENKNGQSWTHILNFFTKWRPFCFGLDKHNITHGHLHIWANRSLFVWHITIWFSKCDFMNYFE